MDMVATLAPNFKAFPISCFQGNVLYLLERSEVAQNV